MNQNNSTFFSQCQTALNHQGHCLYDYPVSDGIKNALENEDYESLDALFKIETSSEGDLFKVLKEFCPVKEIEFIISIRDAKNDWEEDGIWHDDGSRILAFSLSLTGQEIHGGKLSFRKKGASHETQIETPKFGTMIIFKTGVDGYEHKINAVTKGKRIIIAGWCYPADMK